MKKELTLTGLVGPFALVWLVGCGPSTPASTEPSADPNAGAHHSDGPGLAMDAEVGGMNQDEVDSAFKHGMPKFDHCLQDGASRVSFLSGALKFFVKVDKAGKPIEARISESTVGDATTESCMLEVVKGLPFPSPQGGRTGTIDKDFSLPDPEGRPAVAWSESDVGKHLHDAKQILASCKKSGTLTATLYVGPDGKVETLGYAGSGSEDADSCATAKLKSIKFNSPGSFAAKVSITSE